MKLFDDQVPLWELAALIVFAFFGYAIGYSLPLLAGIFLLFWPLFIVQLLFEGLFWALIAGVAWLWRGGKPRPPDPPEPPNPPRVGLAQYIWYVPLVTLTIGYLKQYFDTGTWFF